MVVPRTPTYRGPPFSNGHHLASWDGPGVNVLYNKIGLCWFDLSDVLFLVLVRLLVRYGCYNSWEQETPEMTKGQRFDFAIFVRFVFLSPKGLFVPLTKRMTLLSALPFTIEKKPGKTRGEKPGSGDI